MEAGGLTALAGITMRKENNGHKAKAQESRVRVASRARYKSHVSLSRSVGLMDDS